MTEHVCLEHPLLAQIGDQWTCPCGRVWQAARREEPEGTFIHWVRRPSFPSDKLANGPW